MAAPDPSFRLDHSNLSSPVKILFSITPGTGDLAYRTRGLYVGTGGTLVVVDTLGTEVSLVNVASGTVLPFRVDKVLASTTAADIIGLY